MNRKSKILSLVLSIGIICSIMAILPTIVQGGNTWLAITDWESDDPVKKIPTSVKVSLGGNTSIAVDTIANYKPTGSNATNPYKEDSTQGFKIYNQKDKVCNPGAKSAPTSILLDSDKMKDAKDLRVSMHIKEKPTYTEQFNIGVTVDGVVYYSALTASDYYNFGMYYFKDKTMKAVGGSDSIVLSEDNICKITHINFWVQTTGYSMILLDDIEYSTASDSETTTGTTTGSTTGSTTEPTTTPDEGDNNTAIDKLKENMNLTWSDEFDGDKLNLDNWFYEERPINNPRNKQLHHYNNTIVDNGADNGNVKVENGNLVITAKKENVTGTGSDGKTYTREYTSGGIRTQDQINNKVKKSFKYGIMEARIKMPESSKNALWSAFWMIGVNSETGRSSWPYHGEVDIIEYLSRQSNKQLANLIFNNKYDDPHKDPLIEWNDDGTVASGYDSSRNKEEIRVNSSDGRYTLPDGKKYNDGFHTIGYIWTDTYIQFYVDDTIIQTIDITDPKFDTFRTHEFSFILNLAVGGTFVDAGGSFDGSDLANPSSEATNSMYVDYVRVYQSYTPIAEEITSNSIKLQQRDGYEYSIDGKNWQTSTEFTGLTEDTEYTLYQRVAKSGDTVASNIASEIFKTKSNENNITISYTDDNGEVTSESVAKGEITLGDYTGAVDKTFVGWSDGEKLYAAGDKYTADADTTFTAMFIDIATDDAAAVRWASDNNARGLKFTNRLDKALFDKLAALEAKDGKAVSAATVGTEISKDKTFATKVTVSNNTESAGWYTDTTDSEYVYCGTAAAYEIGREENLINTTMYARAYVTVYYADGESAVFYGKENAGRSMYEVAKAAYDNAMDTVKKAVLKDYYGVE